MVAEPVPETGTVVHAYGVVPGGAAVPVPDTGVGGAGVALLDAGAVAAVFSRLPETEYGDAAWREHADDPRWLADVATRHHEVLAAVVEESDVLPLRLPAMYGDEVHLHRILEEDMAFFVAALGAIHDHVEWGVQLFATGDPEVEATEAPRTGREYLLQRSHAATERQRARSRRHAQVREAYAALADVARQSVANPPQDPALSGRGEQMLLNSAHLVCRRHKDLFFTAVEEVATRLAPAGITAEVSGPWPPYNFVELGAEELEPRP